MREDRTPLPRRGALAVVLAASMLALPFGCANKSPRITYSSEPTPEDEAFLAGVDRPATAGTLFVMARMLANQERTAEAELLLNRSIQQDPRYLASYNELAELHLRRQRVGDAVEVLMTGLAFDPNNGLLRNNLGMCWLVRGEHERALSEFTAAAAALPHDARPRANMATALGLLGRYEESLAAFAQVMSTAEAHYNLAILCEARDDNERAEAEFTTAGTLDKSLRRATPETPET